MIVGLAPGPRGANRTGRAFVGDSSGRTLFKALHQLGLATDSDAAKAQLKGVAISNVVKCLPPGNRPNAKEVANCRSWLLQELELFFSPRARRPRAALALGGVAYSALLAALEITGPRFAHGLKVDLDSQRSLFTSYHPSQQNVNTGRLSLDMLSSLLLQAARHAELET